VLEKGKLLLPQVKPLISPLVSQMVADTKSVVEYQTQRRSWAHAVFFLQQEANLYCNFLRAHRAKMYVVTMTYKQGLEKPAGMLNHSYFEKGFLTKQVHF